MLKIDRIETFVLKTPLGRERFFSSQASFPERTSLLVRLTTSEGEVGWGEGGQYGPPEPVQTCIEKVLGPQLLELREAAPGVVWDVLYARTRDFGQRGPYIEALSAIDIALWDLVGKRLGASISDLMGGRHRDRVRAYGTGGYYQSVEFDRDRDLEVLGDTVAGYAEQGFGMLKIKVGLLPLGDDALRVQTVRERLGEDFVLFADANHAYNSQTAIAMGRVLERHNYEFFEEPVPPEDREGYARVRSHLDLAIAGGEAEYTRWGFRDLIGGGCVDIIQPDVCVCGGISEIQRITALATTHNLRTIPHVWGSGIAFAAAMQVCSSLPLVPYTYRPVPLQNEPVVEFDRTRNSLRDDLLTDAFTVEDGHVKVPRGPGLGVEVNMDVVNEYKLS
ncbi:mandelate racemase/muconate lactonizing enzyme family protein [Brevibacterium sandarakinum]|uniref:mandelate racemase/muconate lactonizing enzyme family protein n=1 Tax=Brevibacterium sandarakinum TaxID=629680 RepID=UPI002651E6B5|nr:mandelate racemase/muconate lactonizing enzyme family protein [Brevibacterium sandarakinum]MDN5658550.1 mandelate racemase/muconate lactonizing enzyme family protein [Brevibacterium sandarakinum]